MWILITRNYMISSNCSSLLIIFFALLYQVFLSCTNNHLLHQLPWEQCLINRDRYRHATSKDTDSYDRLSVIWKSDLTDKMKRSFFQAAVVSLLLCGCTTWTLTNVWRKSLTTITQECCEQYWTSPGDSTLQSTNCTATYHPSRKLSKLDEPDMRNTVGEVGTRSKVMYSCGPLHMDEQRQDVQLEPTYSSSVPIRDVALRTYRRQWTIGRGGDRGSEISVLIARHEDDDL